MEVLFIVILIICIGVVFTVGLLFKLLPYIVCIGLAIIVIGLVIKGIGLVIKGIHSLFLYLHEALGNLYQSVKINCAQKKFKKLINQRFLCQSSQSFKNCIFVPWNIAQEFTQKLDKRVVKVCGFKINLVEEKIEACAYPVEELSPLNNRDLYVSFNQYENVGDIVQGITLLHKIIIIKERKVLPIFRIYQQIARNCKRDQILDKEIIANVEDFKRYQDELYDRERRLTDIISVEWQDIVRDIYKAIKLESNCFVVSSFVDVMARIDELESFINDCEVNKELYNNLAYKTL